MATRKVKDAKDLESNELIYFKSHAKATYMSDGRSVEDAINNIPIGGGGEGGSITESDIAAMGFTKNLGTITEVKMNGASKGTNGVIDLGKVITDVSDKQDKITDLSEIRSGAAAGATALQSVPSEYVTETELTNKGYATTLALNNKVDKVSGKGLSTEDFTTALKEKLQGLTNYDDTTINNAVSSLQSQLNTLVSGNANDAINSFNEIIVFLDGVKDTQDLASIIASIEQQIAAKMDKVTLATVATSGSYNDLSNKPTIPSAVTESTVSGWGFTKNAGTITGIKMNGASKGTSGVVDLGTVITSHQDISGKQDKLVSGTNIKTINGASILGSGNITIEGGSGGVSQEAFDSLVNTVDNMDADVAQLTNDVQGKQDILVSGENIKTINGQSLIGEGDITISGGSGGGSGMEYVEITPDIDPAGATGFIELAEPNKVYVMTEELTVLEIASFAEPGGLESEYRIHFKASDCIISIPDSVIWANGQIPNNVDGFCELSIVGTRYQSEVVYKAVLTSFS